jgi:glutaredoxin
MAQFRPGERMASAGPKNMSKIVLYSRNGCHLCDDAAALLARHGLRFETVDIDADPLLRARYNECVPVIVIDGRERFRGRVDPLLLKRLIDAGR